MITIQEPIYNPGKRRDVMTTVCTLDFDPRAYTTAEAAAKACHEALRKACKHYGQNPDSEVFIREPGFRGDSWYVCWEAGPYDWAIDASPQITGPWGFTEPHYGFDLCFVED